MDYPLRESSPQGQPEPWPRSPIAPADARSLSAEGRLGERVLRLARHATEEHRDQASRLRELFAAYSDDRGPDLGGAA